MRGRSASTRRGGMLRSWGRRLFACGIAVFPGLAYAQPSAPVRNPFPPESRIIPAPVSADLAANLEKYHLRAFVYFRPPNVTRFVVFTPKLPASSPQRVPAVLFLHGVGEAGEDLNLLFRQPGIFSITSPEFQARHPCYLIAPQHSLEDRMPWDRERLMTAVEILKWLCVTGAPKADPDRLYVTGLSSGGLAAYEITTLAPRFFAASVPISASGPEWPKQFTRANVIRYWHICNRSSLKDPAVRRKLDEFRKNVTELGGELRLSLYDRKDHDAWNWAYSEPALWTWLFARSRKGVDAPPVAALNPASRNAPTGAATTLPACRASASCEAAEFQGPEMAVDGLLKSQFVSRGPARKGQYLQVDFDQPLLNARLSVVTGKEDGSAMVRKGSVAISPDGRRFKTVAELKRGAAAVFERNQMIRALRVTVDADQKEPFAVREIVVEP